MARLSMNRPSFGYSTPKQRSNDISKRTGGCFNNRVSYKEPEEKPEDMPEEPEKEGAGLSLSGSGLSLSGGCSDCSRAGMKLAGSGILLAGGMGDPETIPGDKLKKKLLKKMLSSNKMNPVGDRKRTKPISSGFQGGGLVLAGSSSGQSRGRDLGKSYKVKSMPVVGGGIGDIDPSKIISHLQKRALPLLKSENLISESVKMTDTVKRFIDASVRNELKKTDRPLTVIKGVLGKLEKAFNKGTSQLRGSGLSEILSKLGWKLLSGIWSIGNKDSAAGKFAGYMGSGKQPRGGFIFSIAAIIAAISGAAAAASAAASSVAAVSVAGITVGAIAKTAVLAGVGAGVSSGVKRAIEGKGITKQGIVNFVKGVAKDTKIALKDFSVKDKIKLKKGFEKLKQNPTKEGIITLAKSMAPVARKIAIKKVNKVLADKGTKIRLQGAGMGGSGISVSKFNKDFVKTMTHKLTK